MKFYLAVVLQGGFHCSCGLESPSNTIKLPYIAVTFSLSSLSRAPLDARYLRTRCSLVRLVGPRRVLRSSSFEYTPGRVVLLEILLKKCTEKQRALFSDIRFQTAILRSQKLIFAKNIGVKVLICGGFN